MLKNRLIYAAFLVASFLYAYFNGGIVPHLLLQTAIALPIISFLYMLLCYKSIGYSDSMANKIILKNDLTGFHFDVRNKSILFIPFVRIKLKFDKTAFSGIENEYIISLYPLRSSKCDGIVKCRLAGKFTCGFECLETIDLLGIFRLSRKINTGFTMTVLPRVLDNEALPIQDDGGFNAGAAKYRLQTDPLTISDIRKYASGDSFRSIHWKLSAKKRELMVKTHDSVAGTPTMILLDFFPEGIAKDEQYIKRDSILEYASTLIGYCLTEELPLKVSYYSKAQKVEYGIGSMRDFESIAGSLAEAEYDAEVSMQSMLGELMGGSAVQNLIVISANNGPEMISLVSRMDQIGCCAYFYDANKPIEDDGKTDAKTRAVAV